jgi:hypothetical protein
VIRIKERFSDRHIANLELLCIVDANNERDDEPHDHGVASVPAADLDEAAIDRGVDLIREAFASVGIASRRI